MGKEQRPQDKQFLAHLGDSSEASVAITQGINSRDFGVEVIETDGHHKGPWRPVEAFRFYPE